jgi:hypothetical protein
MPFLYRTDARVAPGRLEDVLQATQGVGGDDCPIGRSHGQARGPVEHPERQLEGPPGRVALVPAAGQRMIVAAEDLDDRDPPPEPRMLGIMDLAEIIAVGLLPCSCTTRSVRTARSGIGRRPPRRSCPGRRPSELRPSGRRLWP